MKHNFIEIDGDLILSLAEQVSFELNGGNGDSFDYHLNLNKPETIQKCAKASKRTLLHLFIESVFMDGLSYIMDKHFDKEAIDYMKCWMDSIHIDYSDIPEPEDDCEYEAIEHYADLLQYRISEKGLQIISNAVFSILFNDKNLLHTFNKKLSDRISQLKKDEHPDILQSDGYLNRETPPAWLKDGVFMRDQGRCQECGADLKRLFLDTPDDNYDHIIPLRQGGSNDPTNYQLLCEHCNKSKQDRTTAFKNIIWPYW